MNTHRQLNSNMKAVKSNKARNKDVVMSIQDLKKIMGKELSDKTFQNHRTHGHVLKQKQGASYFITSHSGFSSCFKVNKFNNNEVEVVKTTLTHAGALNHINSL